MKIVYCSNYNGCYVLDAEGEGVEDPTAEAFTDAVVEALGRTDPHEVIRLLALKHYGPDAKFEIEIDESST
jgi:hypothetical protein